MNQAFAIIFIIVVVAIWFFLKKVYWRVGKKVTKEAEDFISEVNDFEVATSAKDKED